MMLKWFQRANLSAKFQLPLMAATFLILCVGGILLQAQVRKALHGQTEIALDGLRTEQKSGAETQRESMESKADAIGQLMVKTAPDFIAAFDLLTLESLEKVAESDREIAYALFLRPDGSPMIRPSLPEADPGIIQKRYEVNYEGEVLGAVLVGLSKSAIDERVAQSEQRVGGVLERVKASSDRTVVRILSTLAAIYGLLLVVLFLLVASLFRRMVAAPLHRIATVIQEMGQGRLDNRLRLERGDEIGQIAQAMDDMAEKLGGMVRRIDVCAGELANASGSIVDVSQKADASAASQARGVNETYAAVQGIDGSVEKVGERMNALAGNAAESTSSILEMASSIDEVAENADELARAAEEVGTSVAEIVASISQVAESTNVLKEASDTTAASAAQLDVSVGQVEKIAKDTAGITEAVRQDAETGKISAEAVIVGMEHIRGASQTVAEAIVSLEEKARSIGSILAVINEVTDQTNLLALNAAIIAAQAGEHGKGFAVVAEEIRELADRTGVSTNEITTMIKSVQQETERAVRAIGEAEKNIAEGEGLSRRSGEALGKIVDGIREVDQRMEQVARATLEQAQGSRMIRKAVDKVSEMIDQTAGATREQSRAAELILTAVERMKGMTAQVRSSTRQQSEGSKLLAKTMEEINGMVQEINRACEEQRRQSGQIMQAVEDIRRSTEVSLESTQVLKETVESQDRQIVVLKREVGAFRLVAGESVG